MRQPARRFRHTRILQKHSLHSFKKARSSLSRAKIAERSVRGRAAFGGCFNRTQGGRLGRLFQRCPHASLKRGEPRFYRRSSYFGGRGDVNAFTTVVREIRKRRPACVFAMPLVASLLINAQSSKANAIESLRVLTF